MFMKTVCFFCAIQAIPLALSNNCQSPDLVDYSIILPTNPNIKHLENRLPEISDPKSPSYRQYMNIEQIKLYTTPSESIRKPVFNWLKNYVVDCKDNGDSLVL